MDTNIENIQLVKYPRTPHLQGSHLQQGDTEEGQVLYQQLLGQYNVRAWLRVKQLFAWNAIHLACEVREKH